MQQVLALAQEAFEKIRQGKWPQSVVIVTEDSNAFAVLSDKIVRRLVCKEIQAVAPCEICHGCRLYAENSHPDILAIEPDGQSIKIDSVRAIVGHAIPTPQGHSQVVVVKRADTMTVQAANSLLKVLEEPKPGLFFLLHARYWGALLPTIRSRTQRLIVPTVLAEQDSTGAGWDRLLSLLGGQCSTTLEARRQDDSYKNLCELLWTQWLRKGQPPLQFADKLSEYAMDDICGVMQAVLFAQLGKKSGVDERAIKLYQNFVQVFGEASWTLSLWQNYKISRLVTEARRLVRANMAHTATYQLDQLVIATKLCMAKKSQ